MKKIKMKTIMANAKISAKIGDIIVVDDVLANDLFKANACEIIEEKQEKQEKQERQEKKIKKKSK